MPEDLISSIIDTSAIQAEVESVKGQLAGLKSTMMAFPDKKLWGDPNNVRAVSGANTELGKTLDNLKVKNAELSAAIKEQRIEAGKVAAQKKAAAASDKARLTAEKNAIKEQKAAEQAREAARVKAWNEQRLRDVEKLAALRKQADAEDFLAAKQRERAQAESRNIGTYEIAQGSGEYGTGKISRGGAASVPFVPKDEQESNLLYLSKLKAELKSNQLAQKDLQSQLKAGTITQQAFDKAIVASTKSEVEHKEIIRLTTAEIKAQAAATLSVKDTISAAQASNKVLKQQVNNIPVGEFATPEDIAAVKALNNEINTNNELIRKNSDALAQQKINIGNYPTVFGGAFKTLNAELDGVRKKISSGDFSGKELDQLTRRMKVLEGATELTGKEFKTSAQEARAYKEATIQIGKEFGTNSTVFKKFAGEVRSGNKSMSGFTASIKRATTGGKGLGKSLTTIYNSMRRLAYIIPGLGIGGLVLLMMVPLKALGESFVKLFKTINQGKITIKTLNDVNLEAIKIYSKQKSEVEALASVTADQSLSLGDRKQALEDLIALSPDYLRGLTLENLYTDEGRVILDKYITSLEKKAELQAAQTVKSKSDEVIANLNSEREALVKMSEDGKVAFNDLSEAQQKFVGAWAFGGWRVSASTLNLNLSKSDIKGVLKGIDEAIKDATYKSKASLEIYKQKFKEALVSGKDSVSGLIEDLQKKISKLQNDQPKLLTPEEITANVAQIKKYQDEINRLLGKSDTKGLSKSNSDRQRLLDKFRDKNLKALLQYSIDNLNILRDMYKEQAGDQEKSYDERLAASDRYFDVSIALLNKQKEEEQLALTSETGKARRDAQKIKSAKLRADTIAEIDKYQASQLWVINQKSDEDLIKLGKDFSAIRIKISEDTYKKLEENAKRHNENYKRQQQDQLDLIDIKKSNDILDLQRQYENGSIKSLEEYNRRKEQIEEKASIDEKKVLIERLKLAERVFEAMYGAQNLALIKKYKDLEAEINDKGNKSIGKSMKEAKRELRDQLENSTQDIIESGFERRQQQNEAELKALDDKTKKEIDAINASGLAAIDKERRVMAIQKQADFQRARLEKQQQRRDVARAKFEKAASIARVIQLTAEAVVRDLKNPLKIAFDIAIGAAQVAAILARPIPKFAKGTKDAPRGLAVVGEQGSELVERNGQMFVSPGKPTLVDLAGGEKIFKHDVTKDILSGMNLLSMIEKTKRTDHVVKVDRYNEKIYRELRTLNGKPPFVINVQNGMETTDYYYRNIKN